MAEIDKEASQATKPADAGPVVTTAQIPTGADEAQTDEESMPWFDKFTLLFALPSFLISLIVHIVLTAVAALIVFATPQIVQVSLEASNSESVSVEDEIQLDELELEDAVLEETDVSETLDQAIETPTEIAMDIPSPEMMAPTVVPNMEQFSGMVGLDSAAAGATAGSDFSFRSGAQREAMAKNNGATAASEAAVELGLQWIAAHQLPQGNWDLNHQAGAGLFRQSPNPGQAGANLGATALAILPFLGKGYTHQEGKYQQTVHNGLKYLILNMRDEGPAGGSLMDTRGTMYSHALGAICLCEAYGMTKDPQLLAPARASLKFIISAQDQVGGGWRYAPGMRGDTSAVGWQLMALKSGQMMGIDAPPRVYDKASRFLDFIQADGGTQYGYLEPAPTGGPGTTAVGLLCRMYLGWGKEHPTLERAIEKLTEAGPDVRHNDGEGEATEANMYYNYYATQIMRHYGDEPWEKWNAKMRDFLIETQGKQGNVTGSWYFQNGHSSEVGGRLYTTAMAVMTLEVYYRHLPLYKSETLEEEFPLD